MNIHSKLTDPVRILVSDNDELTDAISQAQQHDEGYALTLANEGIQALEILQADPFNLAIIDLSLPRLDGLRLTALIRAPPALRHLPILAIASPQQPSSTLESIRAGADDYLPRPIEWPLLAMRIRQLTRSTNYLACA